MGKKVLVVDDQPFMRHMLKKILVEGGYEVAGEAGNGKEALEAYERLRPDLVTLDIVMPEMTGAEALVEIRKADPKARCIVVSAISQREQLLQMLQDGALDYVVKPFEPEQVLGALGRACGS